MRILLLIILALPAVVNAQVNRSARELAIENVQDYLVHKMFRNKTYSPGTFGELQTHVEETSRIAWLINHKFDITDRGKDNFLKTESASKPHKFLFYLDDKMKVIRAETFMVH